MSDECDTTAGETEKHTAQRATPEVTHRRHPVEPAHRVQSPARPGLRPCSSSVSSPVDAASSAARLQRVPPESSPGPYEKTKPPEPGHPHRPGNRPPPPPAGPPRQPVGVGPEEATRPPYRCGSY